MPDITSGSFGVLITLSRGFTPDPEMMRISRWIVDRKFGVTIHRAPDGTIWDDHVDEAGMYPDGAFTEWTASDFAAHAPPDDLALTCRVSCDDEGLQHTASTTSLFVRKHGPAPILDIGPDPHPAEVTRLRVLLADG